MKKVITFLIIFAVVIAILAGKASMIAGILDFFLVLFGILCFFGGIISLFSKEARESYIASIAMIIAGGIILVQAIVCYL